MINRPVIDIDAEAVKPKALPARGRITEADAKQLLPTKPHTIAFSPERLKYLMIAPPKWGKTTFFGGCPNCLLLAFEAGYGFVQCPKIVIIDWDRSYSERKEGWIEDSDGLVYTSAMEVIEALEAYCPYAIIIIDTVDMASKLCTDYNMARARVEHPSDAGDFGRGWALLQTDPFRRFYNRLVKLGVGVAAITHSQEKTDKDKFGRDRFRRETTLPGGIQKFIHSQADVIMHGFKPESKRLTKQGIRYISFDGSDEVLAGSRIKKVYIPNRYIVSAPTMKDDSVPWNQWAEFFKDNPAAGQKAEKDFLRIFEGIEEEVERKERDNVKKEVS
jgi:hypothetical protein